MIRFAFVAFLASLGGCNNTPAPAHSCTILTDGGACVPEPSLAAAETACDGVTTNCDKSGAGAPSIGCLGAAAPAPRPATPAKVTMSGFVRALESGPDTGDISVAAINPEVLLTGANPAFVQNIAAAVAALDGQACGRNNSCKVGTCLAGRCWSKSDGVEPLQRACDSDLSLGCVFALSDGCNHSCNDGLYNRPDDGKYCRDDGTGGTCRTRLRWEAGYSLTNLPTNRTLVMRIIGPGATLNVDWAQVIRWNTVLSTSARACTGSGDSDCLDLSDAATPTYRLDLVAAAQSDWQRLALQAGLSGGVPNGDGAIYGQVLDCDDVSVSGATIGVTPAAARVGYFNSDPLALQFDVTRAASGTAPIGRFAAWGIRGGKVTVDAGGLVGGVVTSLGRDDVSVYAGTLSMITIGGSR